MGGGGILSLSLSLFLSASFVFPPPSSLSLLSVRDSARFLLQRGGSAAGEEKRERERDESKGRFLPPSLSAAEVDKFIFRIFSASSLRPLRRRSPLPPALSHGPGAALHGRGAAGGDGRPGRGGAAAQTRALRKSKRNFAWFFFPVFLLFLSLSIPFSISISLSLSLSISLSLCRCVASLMRPLRSPLPFFPSP